MDDFSIPGQRRDNLVPERMQGFATKQHTLLKWMQSPDAKAQESAAQKRAWATFTKQYPNANKNQFVAQTHIDKKRNVRNFQRNLWQRLDTAAANKSFS